MGEDRRCLVIDAHPTVRMGIRGVLNDRYEVEEAEDWRAGLELLTAVGDFDVAIVDMNRAQTADPALNPGANPIREIRRAQPALGIVAHSPHAERHAAAAAIDAGATAFVAKSSPPEALSAAVDSAAEAEPFVDPAAGRRTNGRGPRLTRRQRQILQLFADGSTTNSVAAQLDLSTETVRTHTKAILARLEARDRAHAVAIALRCALID